MIRKNATIHTHQIWVPRLQRWRKGLKQPIRDKLQQVRSHDERWTWRWHSEHHLDKPGKTDKFDGLNQIEKSKWLPPPLSPACKMACKYSSFSSLLASCAEFRLTRHAIFTPLRKTAWRKAAWRTIRTSAAGLSCERRLYYQATCTATGRNRPSCI